MVKRQAINRRRGRRPTQARRSPMQVKLVKQPMMRDTALAVQNYATYDFTTVHEMRYGGDPPFPGARDFNIAFTRFQPGALLSSQPIYGYNSSAKWNTVKANWEQCAITDLRIVYMPSNLKGQVDTSHTVKEEGIVQSMEVFEDINTYDTPGFTDIAARGVETHQLCKPEDPITIYRSNRKLSHQMNLPWMKCEDIGNINFIDPHPRGTICFRFKTNGMSGAACWGNIKVTYKVHFRGQRF